MNACSAERCVRLNAVNTVLNACSAVFGIVFGCVRLGVNACSAVFGICVRGFGSVARCPGDERVFGCVHCVRVFGSGLTRVFGVFGNCIVLLLCSAERVFVCSACY